MTGEQGQSLIREKRATLAPSSRTRLALNQAVASAPLLPQRVFSPLLGGENAASFDIAYKEVECAREFNFELPGDLTDAVAILEERVATLTGTRKNLVLLFDETSGTYTCLNDAPLSRHAKPRELTRIADHFLQDLLSAEEVLYSDLYNADGSMLGLVAVAEKLDGQAFDLRDEVTLDLVSRYLATKVVAFQRLRSFQTVPYVQGVLLNLSERLVGAVDQEAILRELLSFLGARCGFDVCQYVAWEQSTGEGHVLLENRNGRLEAFTHAGLKSKRRRTREFASLIGLFYSVERKNPYLLIQGRTLGGKSLSDMFGVRHVEAALILPLPEVASGNIQGTINLFHTQPALITEEDAAIAKQAMHLASIALGRAAVLEKAMALATSDELTGLTNRRGFYNRFEVEIERARRNPSSLCVAMIDVDHFKRFNDTYGHLSGDAVLKSLAALFARSVRKSDMVCRFGGEEFAILLPDTPLQSATDLLERVRQEVEREVIQGVNGEALHVTISAGVAQVNVQPGLNRSAREVISEALSVADEQLYAAKENGRNQVCVSCCAEG